MASTLVGIGALAVAYGIYRIISALIESSRFNSFAKTHHCEDPHDATGPFPYGFARLRRFLTMKKTGEDMLDDIFADDFKDKHTVKQTTFEGSHMILTTDPANMQAVLATKFKDFETGARRRNIFYPLLKKSIFSSDGAYWEHSRALFRPQFSRDNINNLASTDKACTTLIEAIGPTNADGWTKTAEMQVLLYNMTLDTSTDFLFGESIESQRTDLDHGRGALAVSNAGIKFNSKEYLEAMETANLMIIRRLRLLGLYWLGDSLEARRAYKVVRDFSQAYVDKALDQDREESVTGKKSSSTDKYSLLSELIAETKDREELTSQTLAVMLAGRDTTAAMVGWCFVRLALHPDIFQKLRNAVLEDCTDEVPDFAQLKSCRYLQHFLAEVLRLHPTVPVNSRWAVRDTTLPKGGGPDQSAPIAVRKGQNVLFTVYLMHRRKDLWGEDVLEFKPERWEQKVPAWQYSPFLGGPRVCLGQQYALTEAGFLLVRMLREFDGIEPVDVVQMKKMRKGLGLTMWPLDGAKVRFHKAAG